MGVPNFLLFMSLISSSGCFILSWTTQIFIAPQFMYFFNLEKWYLPSYSTWFQINRSYKQHALTTKVMTDALAGLCRSSPTPTPRLICGIDLSSGKICVLSPGKICVQILIRPLTSYRSVSKSYHFSEPVFSSIKQKIFPMVARRTKWVFWCSAQSHYSRVALQDLK